MKTLLIRSAFVFALLGSAAFAQDLDAAKFAQPPIPSLLPAAVAQGQANVAATNAAAASAPAGTPADASAATPATVVAAPPAADGHIVSPTPLLVSTGTVQKKESIFFTPNQLISIMRANQGFIAPKEAFDSKNQGAPVDNGPRVISLTGIIYHGRNDWTIWLNGERVTPKNIPDRIMGLTVKPDRATIRWMDIGNQRIVNITLRTNQQYLLDSDTIISGSQ